jgi:DNA-binding Xre family transcriptional regulator
MEVRWRGEKTWVERGVGKLKMAEEREIRRHKLTYFKKKKKKKGTKILTQ